jgi:hypothetical protein
VATRDPTGIVSLFRGVACPWWIAGGYAVELAVGRSIRAHGDIDVFVLRRDQLKVQEAFPGWQLWAADPPGTLRPWDRGEWLPQPIQDVWCRQTSSGPWRFQLMLDASDGEDWVSRRDPRIRRPIETIGGTTSDGIPYLCPEIQLFYKAKQSDPLPKDELDFESVLPMLNPSSRRWLDGALALTVPNHRWRARL